MGHSNLEITTIHSSVLSISIEYGFAINALLLQVLLNQISIGSRNLTNRVYFECVFSFHQKRNPEYEDKVNVIN